MAVGEGASATATWAPPQPTLSIPADLPEQDEYEIRIYDTQRRRRLVAAVEMVSPTNKDRPHRRRLFAAKCAALLRERVCVAIVDVVTTRHFNGIITPDVSALRDQFQVPGTRVLQFAFDGRPDNPYLPDNYVPNTVVYTGTHDNNTTRGWFEDLPPDQRQNLWRYLKQPGGDSSEAAPALLRLAWSSSAALAVAPLQNLLNLDARARMNVPGHSEGNWRWRCTQDMLAAPAFQWLRELTTRANRSPQPWKIDGPGTRPVDGQRYGDRAGTGASGAIAQRRTIMTIFERALQFVPDGCHIGLGSGRAAQRFIKALAERIRSGRLHVYGVPTSEETGDLCMREDVPLLGLEQAGLLELTVDGADEVDPELNLIKGYGRALVREKIVAASSRRFVILVGEKKLVPRLGSRGKLPVEVTPFALSLCQRRLAQLGCQPVPYMQGNRLFVTDNGNHILDCMLGPIADPTRLELDIRAIPGVLGTGLFLGMADTVLVGDSKDFRLLDEKRREPAIGDAAETRQAPVEKPAAVGQPMTSTSSQK